MSLEHPADLPPAESAVPAPTPSDPEPIRPPRPDLQGLDAYVDPAIDPEAFKRFPLPSNQQAVLAWLSKWRWRSLFITLGIALISAVWGLVSNETRLPQDNPAQVLVPKLFRDWWQHYPVLVTIGAAFVAELLTLVIILAERANAVLQTAITVQALREQFKAWQQRDADAMAAHDRWLVTHREVQVLKQWLPTLGEQPPVLSVPPYDLGVLVLLDRFVGREEDIARLMTLLTTSDGHVAAIAAANGLGGIGKTALATEVVRRLHDNGTFADGIAVVICKELTDPIVVLRRVLARFTAGQREPEEDTLAALGSRAAALFAGKHALVVLDNVEQGWRVGEVLAPLRAAGVTLLLTSRAELPTVPREARMRLDVLPADEALDVFAEYYGRGTAQHLTADGQHDARAISEALGRHTLAVKLAAANAATLNRPLATIAQELHDLPNRALLLDNGEEAVGYVLDSSYAALTADAQQLYVALAAFATPDVGRQALLAVGAALGDEAATEKALRDIVALRLADAKPDETMPPESDRERIRLHSLVRSDVEARFARWPETMRSAVLRAVAAYYADYTNETPNAGLFADEANINPALEWAHDQGDENLVADICAGMGQFWRDTGCTRASLRYLPWGGAAAETALGTEPSEQDTEAPDAWRQRANRLFGLLLNEGFALQSTGALDEAVRRFERCLTMARQAQSRRNEGAAASALGYVAQLRGQMEQAQNYFTQALAFVREVQDRQGEGVVLSRLGQVAQARGQLDAAEAYYTQALAIDREVQDRRGEGVLLGSLGQLAQARGELAQAQDYYTQALAIDREVQDRRGEGAVLGSLGQLAQARGELAQAQDYFTQALAIMLEVQDRQGEGVVLGSLGQMAQARGQLDAAEAYYTQALAIDREVQDRQGEGVDLSNLGQVAQARGQVEQAETYFTQSLAIRREVQDRQGEGVDLAQIGLIAEARGRWDEAEQAYRAGISVMEQVQDAVNEATISLMLGRLLIQRRDKHAEGCAFLQRAYMIRRDLSLPGVDEAHQALTEVGCTPQP